MSRVEANLDALKRLQEALRIFAGRQAETIASVEGEIRATLHALEEAEHYWRAEVEERRSQVSDCLVEAAYAAAEGFWVDCSSYQYALYDAEQRLADVLRTRAKVNEVLRAYLSAQQRLTDTLNNDLSRAISFLENILINLEAYREAQVPTSAAGLVAVGLLGIAKQLETPTQPLPGPVTPTEWKEGNRGGPEGKG